MKVRLTPEQREEWRALMQARGRGLRPAPQMTVSQWADRYRRLSGKGSAEPGYWKTARTPYLREIMDCLSDTSPIVEVVMMSGAQVGKSECQLNWLGYIIDYTPGPTMLVQPSLPVARKFSRQRIEPMFETEPLRRKVAKKRSRDQSSSVLEKDFLGGSLTIVGANSASGLRSAPMANLLLDEIDGYPHMLKGEGSPLQLVIRRQTTFSRGKRFKTSTPTIAGASEIAEAYFETDQRRYFVPCLRCGEMQTLEFERLVWTKAGRTASKAAYECCKCNRLIEEHEKTEMMSLSAGAEWRATAEPKDQRIRGYHISQLYAPVGWERASWGEIAKEWEKAEKRRLAGDDASMMAFVNTVLGLPWQVRGEAPEWKRLYDRRESYEEGTVPAEGLILTAGVDVQQSRLVVEVVAWGEGLRSWSVSYGEIPGDPARDDEGGPWQALDALLERTYTHASGAELPVKMLLIDSGYATQHVYAWARRHPTRVKAIKGQGGGGALVGSPSKMDILPTGKRPSGSVEVWPVYGDVAKFELYGWLRLDRAEDGTYPPGYCHTPQYAEEYFQQLTAEHQVMRRTAKGYDRLTWERIPGRENHVLDARVYARAAAYLCQVDRMRPADWARLRESLQ